MKILAFDTTLSVCSLAVMENGQLLSFLIEHERARQVERLFPMIEEALKQAKLTYRDLDAMAVTTGPGSFTGVRIGIAAARGLRLATNLPVIGMSGFEAIAWSLARHEPINDKPILVVLDARRDQVFAQLFDSNVQPLAEAVMLDYAEITGYASSVPVILAGNGKHLVAGYLDHVIMAEDTFDTPDAISLAHAAQQLLKLRPQGDDLAPLYIRLPDAKLPKVKTP